MELNSDRLPPLSSRPLRFSWWSTCSRAEIGGCCSCSLVMVAAFIYGDNKSLDTSLMELVTSNAYISEFGMMLFSFLLWIMHKKTGDTVLKWELNEKWRFSSLSESLQWLSQISKNLKIDGAQYGIA